MNDQPSPSRKTTALGLIGGAIFLGLAVLDWVEGTYILAVGFTAIGIAVIVRTPIFHRLFGLDYNNPGTPLWILSYLMSGVAGVAFLFEIFRRLLF